MVASTVTVPTDGPTAAYTKASTSKTRNMGRGSSSLEMGAYTKASILRAKSRAKVSKNGQMDPYTLASGSTVFARDKAR